MEEITTTIDRGDTIVAVVGDWHGNGRWATKMVAAIGREGIKTILHVGDFGLFRGQHYENYFDDVEAAAASSDINIWITDGNHDDHAWRLQLAVENGNQPAMIRPHIWLLPRGYRWTHAGRTFLSLGGAPSIDYMTRIVNRSWWVEETITSEEVARVSAAGHAEVMITHDAPLPATRKVEHIRSTNPFGFPNEALMYCAAGANQLTQAYEAVRPDLLFHGHYHVYDNITFGDGRRIQSLAKDGDAGNASLLDLTDLAVVQLHWSAPAPTKREKNWGKGYRL